MLLYKSMCELFNKAIYNFLKGKILVNNELKGTSLAQTDIFQKAKYVNVALETVDHTEIYAWLVTPPEIDEKTRIILVLHGNNDNRETFCKNHNVENIVIDHNFAFLVADYRDFGDSKGEFSKGTVKYDIGACLEFLHVGLEMDAVDTVAISLGTCLLFEYIDSCKLDVDKKYFCLLNTPICSDVIHLSSTIEKLKSLMTSGSTIKYKAEGKSFARIQRIALVSPLKSILETIKHIVKLHYAPNFAWKIFDDCFLTPFAFDNTSKVDYVSKENIIVIVGEHDELVPFAQIVELMKKNPDSIIMLDEEDHASTICSDKTWVEIDRFFC